MLRRDRAATRNSINTRNSKGNFRKIRCKTCKNCKSTPTGSPARGVRRASCRCSRGKTGPKRPVFPRRGFLQGIVSRASFPGHHSLRKRKIARVPVLRLSDDGRPPAGQALAGWNGIELGERASGNWSRAGDWRRITRQWMRRWNSQIVEILGWHSGWHPAHWHALARWNGGWSCCQLWHSGWNTRRWYRPVRHWRSGLGETRTRQRERGLDLPDSHHFVHDFSPPFLPMQETGPASTGARSGRPCHMSRGVPTLAARGKMAHPTGLEPAPTNSQSWCS